MAYDAAPKDIGPVPFSPAGFAAAVEARPDLHPVQAIMRGLAGPKRDPLEALKQRRRDLPNGPLFTNAARALDSQIAGMERMRAAGEYRRANRAGGQA